MTVRIKFWSKFVFVLWVLLAGTSVEKRQERERKKNDIQTARTSRVFAKLSLCTCTSIFLCACDFPSLAKQYGEQGRRRGPLLDLEEAHLSCLLPPASSLFSRPLDDLFFFSLHQKRKLKPPPFFPPPLPVIPPPLPPPELITREIFTFPTLALCLPEQRVKKQEILNQNTQQRRQQKQDFF